MYLSPLQLSSNSQIYMSGDVVVDEGAAIAPGVILQADPDSRISIAPGACIGMGVILHAREGNLEVGAGAILGAGVLVVGSGTIGANACIGAGTTLINPCIDKMQFLPAGSLIGDTSRKVALEPDPESNVPQPDPPKFSDPWSSQEPETVSESGVSLPQERSPEPEPIAEEQLQPEPVAEERSSQSEIANVPTILYGQAHINQLLGTLFPHRQAFNRSQENAPPPPEDSG
jgi:carbon dioxide concentrating mechanism protein CcmN